jgi:hypothetical protein
VTDKTTLEATCYISRGHAFWQLSCPAWTWVLDVSTSQWFQRESYLIAIEDIRCNQCIQQMAGRRHANRQHSADIDLRQ